MQNRSINPSDEAAVPAKITIDKWVPLTVQSGFSLPEGLSSGTPRFKLAYGTSTVTSTSTSIATSTLTATCASTTSYGTCAATGK
jgi:hypothetical protein